jgi:hypothetical protein
MAARQTMHDRFRAGLPRLVAAAALLVAIPQAFATNAQGSVEDDIPF